MRKAFAYIRTSTTDQLDKSGPDRQESLIRACAKQNSIEIVKVYLEDVSGATDAADRPVFMDMINDILANGVSLILVEDLSRLARDHHIQDHFLIYLASKDIGLITADTGTDVIARSKEDDMFCAMVQIQGVFNELERKRIVRRLQAGRYATGKLGGRPTAHTPQLRQRIRRMAKTRTYQHIADILNAEDVPTPTGIPWYSQLVRSVAQREPKQKPKPRQFKKRSYS